MPVRVRSRASSSSRKASQFSAMPRSSSSSASRPGAITPPSRTSAAGSASRAACSSCVAASGGARSPEIKVKSTSGPRETSAKSSCFCSVWRKATSSRGRTWPSARRAVMRSTSLVPLSWARSCPARPPSRSAAMVWWRAWAAARARAGASSQRLRQRLPMPVRQVSSSENRVGASSPRRVCTSSRLRRVLAGSSICSPARSTASARTCVSARPCVCSA